MFTLIIPAAGKSKQKPYWSDFHPNGNLMIFEGIKGLDIDLFDRIIITIFKEDDENYNLSKSINYQFEKEGLHDKLTIVSLNFRTNNEPETVFQTIYIEKIRGAIFIKDIDNYFKCNVVPGNYIVTFPMDQLSKVNPQNKSYLLINDDDLIENIIEKELITKYFCVGGYGFSDASEFCNYYSQLKDFNYLYLSHIIYKMLLDNQIFRPLYADSYLDWGTLVDWRTYINTYKTLFIDLEGVLVNDDFIFPEDLSIDPIPNNIDIINKLYETGLVMVVILTKMSKENREYIESLLITLGINYHDIVFNTKTQNKDIIERSNQSLLTKISSKYF